MSAPLYRRLIAEGLGTAMLLATVIGSGIMGARLANGTVGLALLANAIATGAMLVVLILIFGPLSGAHFNPIVSLAEAFRRNLQWKELGPFVIVQVAGAIAGVWTAHLMFDLSVFELSNTFRTGPSQWFSEAVASFGLLLTVFGCMANAPKATPYAMGLYITAAYWFTASTSFANPAVTIARAFSDTFAGIAPQNVAAFVAAQIAGTIAAIMLRRWLWPLSRREISSR
ncbi:MAG: aquaporin family protein [Bradyrhizobiaceae bacterium]|nr:MAG: aquaporin family protein [Bradyrhizobiaceae bacterium]